MKKQYPLVLGVAVAGVLIGSLFLTGNFPGIAGQSAPPAIDHPAISDFPLDVKFVSKDRERALDAIGSHYFYVDENFIDDENHCEFCIFAEYKAGTFGRAVYAFESKLPLNLGDAKTLTFLARGEIGGEVMKIYAAGKKVDPTSNDVEALDDGLESVEFGFAKELILTKEWVKYEVDLVGLDLSDVSHPFAFEMVSDNENESRISYLDLIFYDKVKPDYATRLN